VKRPTFLHAALAAFGIAFAAGAVFAALGPIAGADAALRLAVPLMSLAWLLCLLRRGRASAGRITVLAFWCAASAATWLLAPPLGIYVLVHAGLLWLARSLCFYAGLFPALLDMGLSALSLSAAIWASTRSGSVFLAAWTFFLLQALFVFIPPQLGRHRTEDTDGDDHEAFERARRRADTALRQLLDH
jgi:hypothetical protein